GRCARGPRGTRRKALPTTRRWRTWLPRPGVPARIWARSSASWEGPEASSSSSTGYGLRRAAIADEGVQRRGTARSHLRMARPGPEGRGLPAPRAVNVRVVARWTRAPPGGSIAQRAWRREAGHQGAGTAERRPPDPSPVRAD